MLWGQAPFACVAGAGVTRLLLCLVCISVALHSWGFPASGHHRQSSSAVMSVTHACLQGSRPGMAG